MGKVGGGGHILKSLPEILLQLKSTDSAVMLAFHR